jgi:hypothetical protein
MNVQEREKIHLMQLLEIGFRKDLYPDLENDLT